MYKRRSITYKTQRAFRSAGRAPSPSDWAAIQNDVQRARRRNNENQIPEDGSERSPNRSNPSPASQNLL